MAVEAVVGALGCPGIPPVPRGARRPPSWIAAASFDERGSDSLDVWFDSRSSHEGGALSPRAPMNSAGPGPAHVRVRERTDSDVREAVRLGWPVVEQLLGAGGALGQPLFDAVERRKP
jgi:hypothetical protein